MKLDYRVCFLLLVIAAVVASARKGKKKDRKTPPKWKSKSMPALNKRFESVNEDEEVRLDCRAQGHPRPSITWYKDGIKIMDTDTTEMKKFYLTLKSVTIEMSGNYSCVVNNKHGQVEWTFHLDVKVGAWPLVLEGPNNITQVVGSDVAFRCRVLNDPAATIRWQKIGNNHNRNGNTPQSDYFLPDGDDPEILSIDNIQKEDEGEYRCMAGNVHGLKYSAAWLTVIVPIVTERPDAIFPAIFDPYDPNNQDTSNTGRTTYYDGYNPGLDQYDFGPNPFETTTTRRPKNRNNRRKNGRKKDRKKDRDRNRMEEDDTTPETTTTTTTTSGATTMRDMMRSTFPVIWNFDNNNDFDGGFDSRYNKPVIPDEEEEPAEEGNEPAEEGNTGSATSSDNQSLPGSISSWTIYTIVGAIGGVILLIGLVAITLTLCCQKEEGGVYKSTPV